MNATATATQFAKDLQAKFATISGVDAFTVTAGRKYDKIAMDLCGQRSVHAFVERATGALLKPAGWATPAPGARYDLSTPEGYAQALEAANFHGGYLYR